MLFSKILELATLKKKRIKVYDDLILKKDGDDATRE